MSGRVLILDESSEMRDLFSDLLAREGHDVRSTTNLSASEDLGDFVPDIVLADAALADTGGPEVTPSVAGPGPDIPAFGETIHHLWPDAEVVYLVDASRSELRRRLERGRLRHFARPFQIEDLHDLVDGLVSRRSATGSRTGRGKVSR